MNWPRNYTAEKQWLQQAKARIAWIRSQRVDAGWVEVDRGVWRKGNK